MKLAFGYTHTFRELGDFTEIPVINMFAEEEQSEEAVSLISRPGLIAQGDFGGAVVALYQNSGVLDGDMFAISDTGTYLTSPQTLIGSLSSVNPNCSIAGFPAQVFFCDLENVKSWDGSTFAAVTIPNSDDISKIVVGASRLILLKKDSSQFYWSDVLDDNIDALSFATAENSADRVLDMLYIGDALILFGTETIEFWPSSTSDDLPFQPLKGRVFEVGIREQGCCTELEAGFAWIARNGSVYVNSPQNKISFPGLEAELEYSTSVRMWRFFLNGLEFICIRTLDSGTGDKTDWVYCVKTGSWSQFEKYGEDNWTVSCFAGTRHFGGDDGLTYTWNTSANPFLDFDGQMERRFRAGTLINTGNVTVNSLRLRGNQGNTDYTSGLYSDPDVEARFSRDGGYTWSGWKPRPLGQQGEYRREVSWNSQGMFSYPSLLVEFKVTDPVGFRVSDIVVNEERMGR